MYPKISRRCTRRRTLCHTTIHILHKPLGISWPDKPIKLLGLYIGHNEKDLEVTNFRHKLDKMKTNLNIWKQRNLTLIGKVLIIKTSALSQFRYLSKVIAIPENTIKEIELSVFEYVWGGKTHKVKINVVIQDYKFGGLRMEEFKDSIKVEHLKLVKSYLGTVDGRWKNLMEVCVGEQNLNLILLSNYNIKLF